MLSIHLGSDDLGRIRFASEPAPALETVLMLNELRHHPRPLSDGRHYWREHLRSTFPARARPLLNLVPSVRTTYYFDVMTPDADEAFHRIRAMPRSTLDDDLNRISQLNVAPVPTWLRRFAAGDDSVRQNLDDALRIFHRTCLAPHWSSVSTRFHDDVAYRMDAIRQHGIAAMLTTLSPDLRLNGSILEGRYPWNRHIHLENQGLVLIPSAFWTGYPLATWDDQEPSRNILIYPARFEPSQQHGHGTSRDFKDALAALLGATRAAVLLALRQPLTTSGIARMVNISVSSASEHTATLRDAGLITTDRRGRAVEHHLTSAGYSFVSRAGARTAGH